jgi:hypothetical protein
LFQKGGLTVVDDADLKAFFLRVLKTSFSAVLDAVVQKNARKLASR